MHELVIRGGTVVDGTGAPAMTADVDVSGGRITEVGKVDERGERELDADGLVVAPGWVDIHTHYDGPVTWDPDRKSGVEGKSVSGRVDLGGRRIITQKEQILYTYIHIETLNTRQKRET